MPSSTTHVYIECIICVCGSISLWQCPPTLTHCIHILYAQTNNTLSEKQQQQQPQQRGDNGECESLLTNAKCIKLFKVLFANMQINIESAFVFVFVLRQARCGAGGDAGWWCWLGTRVLGMPCRKLAWQLSSAQLATHGWQFKTQSSFAPDGHRSTAQLSLPTHTHTHIYTPVSGRPMKKRKKLK